MWVSRQNWSTSARVRAHSQVIRDAQTCGGVGGVGEKYPCRVPVSTTHRATSPWQPTQAERGTIDDARTLLASLGSVAVVTGAGMSTPSGIPDYRGPLAARATPMLYDEFTGDVANQRRYWARAYAGWARMGHAEPNPGHHALAAWEHWGLPCHLTGVITQNVDVLHDEAGQRRLVHLHGSISDVVCLVCGDVSDRAALQGRLQALNPHVGPPDDVGHAELRPDGDAVVDDWSGFVLAGCSHCGGPLKPDVVFFGEAVPRNRVAEAVAWVDQADGLVVIGSSLTVMSGLRFVRQAFRIGKPVVIVNRGATRGDEMATVRLDADVVDFLQRVTS